MADTKATPSTKTTAKPATKRPAAKVAKKATALKPATKSAVKTAVKVAPTPTAAVKTPPAKPVQAPKAVKPPKVDKPKHKLVRDSFTMPAEDWALIQQLKERALGFKRPTKKSELLRAGLQALAALPAARLKAALDKLQPLKPGRPKGEAKADKK